MITIRPSYVCDNIAIDNTRPSQEEMIQVITLDQFIKDHPLSRVDFIKIDVEGHELNVLLGSQETIATYKPALMIEVCENYLKRANASKQELFEFFAQLNYQSALIHEQTGKLTLSHNHEDGDYLFTAL